MTMPTTNYSGRRWGLLVAVKPVELDDRGRWKWEMTCDCGGSVVRTPSNMHPGKASCGCHKPGYGNRGRAPASKRHGMSKTRLFKIWQNMVNRCHSPKNYRYADYGKRGITVCDEWRTSVPFLEWALSHGYADHLQIDRIDNDRGYSPDNCRWVTPSENMANQRNSLRYSIFGEVIGMAEMERRYGIKRRTFIYRVELLGLTPEEAATTPLMRAGARIQHGRYSKHA